MASDNTSRVARILDGYLAQVAAGAAPGKQALLAEHSELADSLEACLASLEWIGAATAEHGEPVEGTGDAGVPSATSTLGDFHLLRVIGRGGMGVVYEAQQQSLGRRVALKVLPFAAMLDPRQRQRFLNEAQAAAQLNHPHIIDVIAVGVERGVHYYAMRLVDGPTLAEVVEELRLKEGTGDRGQAEAGSGEAGKRGRGEPESEGNGERKKEKVTPNGDEATRTRSASEVAERRSQESEVRSQEDEGSAEKDGEGEGASAPRRGTRAAGRPRASRLDAPTAAITPEPEIPSSPPSPPPLFPSSLPPAASAPHSALHAPRSGNPQSSIRDPQSPTTPIAGISTDSPREYYRSIARLMADGAAALDYAHEVGVIHRDVKPSNLMVDGRGKVWVTDFGLARLEANAELTMTGDLLGTLRYMSPEQVAGDRSAIDHRTDVYSLGATLYELLTLRPAFSAHERAELLRRIAVAPPRPPRKIARSLPVELETIVLKALEKDPADRYRTAGELADDLRRFLDHRPIRARRSRVIGYAKALWRRHQVLFVAVIATLLVASSVGSLLIWRQWRRATEEHAQVLDRDAYLRERLYASDIRAAHQAWRCGDVVHAGELLARYEGEEGDGLRGFEWYHLRELLASCSTPLHVFEPGGPHVYEVRFSPDGALLATCAGGRAKLWSTADWSLVRTIDARGAGSVAFSPDGNSLVTAGDQQTLRFWNIVSGDLLRTLDSLTREVLTLAVSPDGETLACGGVDGMVRLWNMADGQPRGEFRGSRGRVQSIAFSADSAELAVGAGDYTATIWNAETLTKRIDLESMGHANYSVAYSPDGTVLASGNGHGLVGLYNPSQGKLGAVLGQHRKAVRTIAFSPAGDLLASGDTHGLVELWDVAGRSLRARLVGHHDRVWSVSFSPDGRWLASASDDGSVRVWDATAQPALKQAGHRHPLYSVHFSDDGKQLLTGAHFADALTWDLPALRQLSLRPTRGMLLQVSLDPERRSLAACSDLGEVYLGGPFSGSLTRFDPGQGAAVRAVALDSDGRLVLSRADGWLEVWEPHAKVLLDRRRIGGSAPELLATSSDGRLMAIACDGLFRVFELEKLTARFQRTTGEFGYRSVAFAPDGRTLAVGLVEGPILLLDAQSGEKLASLGGHQLGAHALAFNVDARTLASFGGDGTLRLWHIATRQELLTLHRVDNGMITSLAFSPDGGELVATAGTPDARGELFRWSADPSRSE